VREVESVTSAELVNTRGARIIVIPDAEDTFIAVMERESWRSPHHIARKSGQPPSAVLDVAFDDPDRCLY
jgi:hypothetical protein